MTTRIPPAVRLAGGLLDRTRGHVWAFFHSQEEAYRVLLPFVTEGVAQGDKVIHIADPQDCPDHLRRLHAAGGDVATTQAAGQMEVLGWDEAYLRDAHFDQHAMLTLVEDVLSRSRQQGFPLTRLTANMAWALQDLPGVQDLVEYEARANYVLPQYHDAVV
jgi:MEDS: MEthanogen/methylotroph, DcmR Sensory domain